MPTDRETLNRHAATLISVASDLRDRDVRVGAEHISASAVSDILEHLAVDLMLAHPTATAVRAARARAHAAA